MKRPIPSAAPAPSNGHRPPAVGSRPKLSPEDSKLRVVTWEEVREHRSEQSCWVVVANVVYDVTGFLPKHPGGPHVLLMAAGQDITYLMETSHPFTRTPWHILSGLKVARIDGFVQYPDKSPFYETVKARVKKYFDETKKDEKDWWPTFQVFLFLVTMWSVGLYGLCRGSVVCAVALGASRALFGIHTMHACSHFAFSHKPWVWRWIDWLCFDIFMGGSSLAWDYQHVVGHHQHTNVFQADPDLPIVVSGDMRRVVPAQKWQWIYKFQAFYLPVLYTLLAFKTRWTDAMVIAGDTMNGNIHMRVTTQARLWLVATKVVFAFYQFYVPLFIFNLPLGQFLVCYVACELTSGAWLAYFFQVNHISDNVAYVNKDDGSTESVKEWAALQVEGTVDYAHNSPLWAFLSGHLNYQVVHHLFPSVCPHHYPAIAPIVKKACDEFGINYQILPSFTQAAINHVKELHKMGGLQINAHHSTF